MIKDTVFLLTLYSKGGLYQDSPLTSYIAGAYKTKEDAKRRFLAEQKKDSDIVKCSIDRVTVY